MVASDNKSINFWSPQINYKAHFGKFYSTLQNTINSLKYLTYFSLTKNTKNREQAGIMGKEEGREDKKGMKTRTRGKIKLRKRKKNQVPSITKGQSAGILLPVHTCMSCSSLSNELTRSWSMFSCFSKFLRSRISWNNVTWCRSDNFIWVSSFSFWCLRRCSSASKVIVSSLIWSEKRFEDMLEEQVNIFFKLSILLIGLGKSIFSLRPYYGWNTWVCVIASSHINQFINGLKFT